MKGIKDIKLAFVVFIIFSSICLGQSGSKFKVVLDAGHGGKDYGAIYHGFAEKNIALNVALKVGKLLEKHSDVELIYTRKSDVFIELNERANIANDAKANIFVSIHCNGAVNQSAFGTETFVMGLTRNASNLEVAKKENDVIYLESDYKVKYKGYDPNKPETAIGFEIMQQEYLDQSIDLASKVQDAFTYDLKRKSRGVKQAGFLVLRNIYMPRILIELGFLSHKPEGEYLNSEAGQDKLAKAIADAILAYKKEYFIPLAQSTVKPEPAKVIKPEPEAEPVAVKQSNDSKATADGVIYKVQIAASSKDLETVPSNFNGLDDISKDTSTSVIKYFYGSTGSYDQAKELQAQAKAKGFDSAFVVAFANGKKISVQEALKIQGNSKR
ncbi:N-acetylmuramoyl-L-alanine amidase [Flavobacterium coralii]|uniref:N-acetylmuramoyl-L-alanine amidase family protein n=1 Tax=Flavobacterium coralii TaxID=2838017 RepID=UPI000C6283C8|nr:N-acetylmuramoyl-L-alanine amidase [Flavobacterium coralii]MBE99764.1 N-acetylmuramoyl-L-alanine amidase [Flavobacterium sp.]MBY8961383.1 N-acetylmuramoyl-L-alanine amidase [Flavobacterium coralii]|tara:strand:+ start:15187 stop:16338 length:1152 start_codon:yes stop_codon:yes gene_type:complete